MVAVFVTALGTPGMPQTSEPYSTEAGIYPGPSVDSCSVEGAERGIAWSYGVSPSDNPGVYEVHYGQKVVKRFATTEAWHGATDGPITKPKEFYATEQGGSLYLINPNTATITAVGNYGGPTIRELGFKEPNQVLYGTDYDNLYVINQATGEATLIGDMKVGGVTDVDLFWAMDYDEASGELLAISEATNMLYKVDVNNANLDTIGSTNVTRLTDIWYDKHTGNIYAVSNGDAGNYHYIVNRNTGNAEPIPPPDGVEFCCNLLGLGDVRYQGVPALTNWGLLVLLVLLVISGIIVIRHRRRGTVRA